MPKYLTLEETAERLGVDYKTVYRLVRAGELPAGRVGRIYRVRKEDIDAYFERQQLKVAEEASVVGPSDLRRCGACGKEMLSKLSVGGGCEDCGESICLACWAVGKKRRCTAHEKENDNSDSPATLTSANKSPAGFKKEGQKTKKNKRGRETPQEAAERLRKAGAPAVTAGEARLAENNFLRSFSQKIELVEQFSDPLTSKVITLRDARVKHELSPKKGESSGPNNASSTFTLKMVGWGKSKAAVVLESRCVARLDVLNQQGYDASSLEVAELTPLLDELAEKADKAGCFHLALIASPTGWTPEAVKRIVNRDNPRSFHHKYAEVVLFDLHNDEVHYDESDQRLFTFWQVIAPKKYQKEVEQCEAEINSILKGRKSLTLEDAVRETNSHESFVVDAFRRLKETGDYAVDLLEGIGTVISHRKS